MITNLDIESLLSRATDQLIRAADQLVIDSSLLKLANSYMSEKKGVEDKVLEFEKIIAHNTELIEKLKEVAKEWAEAEEWEESESITS